MRIEQIRAFPIDVTPQQTTQPRVPQQTGDASFVSPMRRYSEYTKAETAPIAANRTLGLTKLLLNWFAPA